MTEALAKGANPSGEVGRSELTSLHRALEAQRQLHEHKGPYYDKWRRAMRRAFAPKRRRGRK